MAKAKQTRRMMAMALAASMVTSMAPVQAFAGEDVGENPSVTQNADGSTTTTTKTETGDGTVNVPKVTVTVSETKDANGNTTSTTTTTETKVKSDKTGDVTTDKTETKTETVTPNGSGTTTETTTTLDQTVVDDKGTATKSDDKTVVTDVTGESTVEKTESGKTTSGTGYEEGTETTTDVYSPETSVPVIMPDDDNTESGESVTLPEATTNVEDKMYGEGDSAVSVSTTTKKEPTSATKTTDADGNTIVTTKYTVTTTQPKLDGNGNLTYDTDNNVVMEDVVTELVETEFFGVENTVTNGPDTNTEDGEWDYTDITTDGREVSVTFEPEKIYIFTDEENNNIDNLKPITPVWHDEKEDISNGDGDALLGYVDLNARPEGYDVAYVGYGEDTEFGAYVEIKDENGNKVSHSLGITSAGMEQFELSDVAMQKVDEKGNLVYNEDGTPVLLQQKVDENGNPVVDENGNPVYDGDGKKVLIGNVHTGYCVDLSTYTQSGWWYQVKNLNDAGYYSTERTEENGYVSDADHIRGVVLNGYWGTKDAYEYVDERTGETVKVAAETGSLDDVKAKLQAAYDAAKEITNEDGTKSKDFPLTQDDINRLTEGEASAATQMAIWKYGNHEGGEIFLNSYGSADNNTDEEKADAWARIDLLAKYLTTLYDKNEETDIITQDKFIESMDFVVGDKVDSYIIEDETTGEKIDVNKDADDTNDVYNVSLKFALVVTPSDDSDDLIVKVVNGNNEVIASARIAGENDGDEKYEKITADAEGNYTLSGLKLSENKDIDFELKLEGTQKLEQGVYIYQSEMRVQSDGTEETSQTFVGIAEGTKNVSVGANIELNFNVEEGTISAKHSWKKTWDYEDEGNGGGGHYGDDDDDDIVVGDDDDDDGVTGDDDDDDEDDGMVAGDEDENAADEEDDGIVAGDEDEIIAATADNNHIIGAAGGMFAALAGLFGLRKRKEN